MVTYFDLKGQHYGHTHLILKKPIIVLSHQYLRMALMTKLLKPLKSVNETVLAITQQYGIMHT